jgi:hypothetical protein
MAESLMIEQDIIEDLLTRLSDKGMKGKEAAIEALAISTEDDGWRPEELIRQGGIKIVRNMLQAKNKHIVYSALKIIVAVASTGETEALIEEGVIACLDAMADDKNTAIRDKAREALALLQPDVGEAVISKPQDEY